MSLKSNGVVLSGIYTKVINGGVNLAFTELFNESTSDMLVCFSELEPINDDNSFTLSPGSSYYTFIPIAHAWAKGTGKIVVLSNKE